MKTLVDLAQDALDVQDACNLTGVVHGFSRAMTRLRELEPGKDTEFYNRHAVSVLWAGKIAQLTACEDEMNFSIAYSACSKLTNT